MPSACLTWSETFEPRGPRIFRTAFSCVQPSVDSPSTVRMTSPGLMPARSAGVPSIGATMTIWLFDEETVAPMPSKVPLGPTLVFTVFGST